MKHLLLPITLLPFLASCSKDDPVTPNPPSTTYVKVIAGSSFTYEKYETDSTGAKVAGTSETITETVLQTDMTRNGKSGVFMVVNNDPTGPDTSYFAYESNNDISLELSFSQSELPPLWVKMPVASGGSVLSSNSVTVEHTPGFVSVLTDSVTVSQVGSQNITVKGSSIATTKMKMSMRLTATGAIKYSFTVDTYVYYAPSLGYYVKMESAARPDPAGGWIHGNAQVLTDYTLK